MARSSPRVRWLCRPAGLDRCDAGNVITIWPRSPDTAGGAFDARQCHAFATGSTTNQLYVTVSVGGTATMSGTYPDYTFTNENATRRFRRRSATAVVTVNPIDEQSLNNPENRRSDHRDDPRFRSGSTASARRTKPCAHCKDDNPPATPAVY